MIAWIMLVVLLPLFAVPWSQAHQGQCSPRMPACEMTCCKDMSSDNTTHHSECPCQDTDQGCDCACCLHIASTMPPVVMSAPQTCPHNAQCIRPLSQRAPSRTERPPLPPPKTPASLSPRRHAADFSSIKPFKLTYHEKTVSILSPHPDPHGSVCSHPIQHGRQVQLLPCRCLLHRWRLLRHG
jgi:hypothetical protein